MSAQSRLIAWYIAATGALAVMVFVAVLLTDGGYSPAEASATLMLVPIGHLIGAPLWSWVADVTGARMWVVRVATALSATGAVVMFGSTTNAGLVAGLALYSFSRAPIGPVTDALTVATLGDDRRSYGRIRAWGSVSFIVAAWVGAQWRETWPDAPLAIAVALTTITAVMAWWLPVVPPERGFRAPIRRLVLHPVLGPLVVVAFLHGLTVAHYDGLYSVLVESQGWPSSVVGWSVALGVSVEVLVMLNGRRLLDRFGPVWVLTAGVASGVPRWFLMGVVRDPISMTLVQSLHGLSFGAFWIGGVALLSEHAPPGLGNASQSILPAAAFGAGRLTALAMATALLDKITLPQLFLVDSVISLVATALAVTLARRMRTQQEATGP